MAVENGRKDKRAWRTPKIERLLTQGAAAGPMVTMTLGGTPMEGKAAQYPTESMFIFRGGPS